MSDPTAPVEGVSTSPASTETAAPAHDPIADRMDQLSGTVGELVSGFQQWQQSQAPAAAPEADDPMAPWAALWGDQEQEQQFEAQPTLDPAALQSAFQQAIAQSNAPLLEKLQRFEVEQATNRLYEQIPQLKEVAPDHPDYATNHAARQATHQAVATSLQNYPSEIANALAADPNYIATVFRAAEAQKLAAGQAPASETVPNTESAGGAVPGGNGAPVNPVHQAYGANRHEMPAGFK